MSVRVTQGLRNRRQKRTEELVIALSTEEKEAIFSAAGFTGDFAAVWARDVLLARAAGLYRQRMLIA